METGKEIQVNEQPIEQRALEELIHLRKNANPLRKLQIRRAIKDLKAGNFSRAENILHEEALEAGESAMTAEHISWGLGHAPGSINPKSWDKSEYYGELASGLRAKITESK